MTSTKKRGGEGVHKILKKFECDCVWFLGRGLFFWPFECQNYGHEMSFFHHISSFLAIVWLLLHCFHPKNSFLINLYLKMKTLEVHKLFMIFGLVQVCSLSCQIYYIYENCNYCWQKQRKNKLLSMLILLWRFSRKIQKHHYQRERGRIERQLMRSKRGLYKWLTLSWWQLSTGNYW